MKNALHIGCAALLACALSTTAAAQVDKFPAQRDRAPAQTDAPPVRSNTAGFNLGVFLNGSAIQMDGSDVVESGRGGSLHVGYGFTESASVFARANAASIQSADLPGESYTMAHVDLGIRLSGRSSSDALRPFVQAAVSGRSVSIDGGAQGELQARGLGASAGLGLEYFVNPSVAIEAGLSFSIGEFNEGRLGGSEWVDFGEDAFQATSSRFDLGISLHP